MTPSTRVVALLARVSAGESQGTMWPHLRVQPECVHQLLQRRLAWRGLLASTQRAECEEAAKLGCQKT